MWAWSENRFRLFLNQPIKDIGEKIIMAAINSRECIESLSMYFKRDYRNDNKIFRGDLEAEVIQKRNIIQKERLHLRFKAWEPERISALAYSMDCSVSLATTMLLIAGIRNRDVFTQMVDSEVIRLLDPGRLKSLKMIQKDCSLRLLFYYFFLCLPNRKTAQAD
ncbi:UNVERIFIED_ORG: hypothetical protein QFZ59_003358 [Bacillus sp. B2I3]|nr:hypothetical protein [Bacillus sp. B2I3]